MELHLIQCPVSCDLWLVGAAFSRDLPGQSRLKTAPTIKNSKVSFLIRLAVFQARGAAYMKLHQVKSEPQNRRISNIEGWVRFAQAFFNKRDRIPYFDIRYSFFQSFFFDQAGRFFLLAAKLTSDT